jgi:hypothetical protein
LSLSPANEVEATKANNDNPKIAFFMIFLF